MQDQINQISPPVMGLEERTLHGQKVATSQTQLLPESPVALLEQKMYERGHISLIKGEGLLRDHFSSALTSNLWGSPRATPAWDPGSPGFTTFVS